MVVVTEVAVQKLFVLLSARPLTAFGFLGAGENYRRKKSRKGYSQRTVPL